MIVFYLLLSLNNLVKKNSLFFQFSCKYDVIFGISNKVSSSLLINEAVISTPSENLPAPCYKMSIAYRLMGPIIFGICQHWQHADRTNYRASKAGIAYNLNKKCLTLATFKRNLFSNFSTYNSLYFYLFF